MQITGKVRLDRFDRDFRLLERREQPMRSWTKGLLEILYISHAQIVQGAPYSGGYDIDKTPRAAYQKVGAGGVPRWMSDHGKIVSPGGFTPPGNVLEAGDFRYQIANGCDMGIQIGTDNTAVTPTDNRLRHRIGHGQRAADGGDVTFEAEDTGDTNSDNVINNDNTQLAAPFNPKQDFRCSSVEVKVFKTLAPAGPLTVEIRAPKTHVTQFWACPSSTVLATGTIASAAIGASPGAFVACVFGTPIDLYAGHEYFIVLHSAGVDGANYFSWRWTTTTLPYDRNFYVPASAVSVGDYMWRATTTDAWTTPSVALNVGFMFRVIGRSIGEMEYGGCDLVNYSVINPNASFDLRRFFYNRSGGSIDVREVGISTRMSTFLGNFMAVPWLIARDVVAPAVTVNNTEILLVTYTPAIVV